MSGNIKRKDKRLFVGNAPPPRAFASRAHLPLPPCAALSPATPSTDQDRNTSGSMEISRQCGENNHQRVLGALDASSCKRSASVRQINHLPSTEFGHPVCMSKKACSKLRWVIIPGALISTHSGVFYRFSRRTRLPTGYNIAGGRGGGNGVKKLTAILDSFQKQPGSTTLGNSAGSNLAHCKKRTPEGTRKLSLKNIKIAIVRSRN